MYETSVVPPAISWHEGMLLSPQHFQEQDRRIEGLFRFHAQNLEPYYWGVNHLRIDEAALTEGELRLTAVDCVLPDGLVVAYRRGADPSAAEPVLRLGDHRDSLRAAPQKVFLGVIHEADTDGASVSLRRFDSVAGVPVVDMLAGGRVRIPRLAPRLALFLGRPSDMYSALPLLELTVKGEVPEVTDFVHPVLAADRNPEMMRMCRDLSAGLRRKAGNLSAMLADENHGDDGFRRDTRETLACLVAGLPLFETLLNAGRQHPFRLYQALVQLMSALVPLSRSKVPPLLGVYNHDQPINAFREVRDYIASIIDARIHEAFSVEPFQREGETYVVAFRPEWEGCELVLGLGKDADTSQRDVLAWMNGALIGNRRAIPTLRRNRVLGFKRTFVEKLPGLAPGRDTVLFPLSFDEQELAPGEDLVISPSVAFSGDMKPPRLILFVRNKNDLKQ
ncbi:type VI secretion system baseplate subunit TssK [Acanthopleuribacter pedis]|uniref:Type VI secretion system baseplate subunit TssK n=1 Tax=Acanthopleuribacter pedis TaxID=442870 RepID=A0A8J7U620_9BACT|nr:type VI secretion system baseplate subunit TssK [Acanthopleuribacter pedis]MBO1321073.1 type VI secretion system baseplate subunit TssK [Acanthopleuribacter pedis]